jgi:hypothetical protein
MKQIDEAKQGSPKAASKIDRRMFRMGLFTVGP